MYLEWTRYGLFERLWRQFSCPRETLRPERCQPFAVQVEIAQREAGAQPVVVLLDASVSHLLEAKDTFQDPERMFYFGSDSGLGGVAPPGLFVDIVLEPGSSAGHVLGVGRG